MENHVNGGVDPGFDDAHKLHADASNATVDLSKLSERERMRIEHMRLHEKHKGHEAMHAEMMIILIVTLIVAQILLMKWKEWHFRSYQRCTLVGMCLIPIAFSIYNSYTRFVVIWCVFSAITGVIVFKATRKPLDGRTPRWVYKWFLLIYKISYGLGIIGYMGIIFSILGLNMLFLVKTKTALDFSIVTFFYGLYYGVVSRDFAEVCSDTMASHIGYYTVTGLPGKRLDPNICAVCGNPILVLDNKDAIIETTCKLNCDHVFHEFCIRGWCIVGKKQTCPYCKEKVDLKRMFPSPWDRTHVMFGNLLDWVRYFVAWQPVIMMFLQAVNVTLGLE